VSDGIADFPDKRHDVGTRLLLKRRKTDRNRHKPLTAVLKRNVIKKGKRTSGRKR